MPEDVPPKILNRLPGLLKEIDSFLEQGEEVMRYLQEHPGNTEALETAMQLLRALNRGKEDAIAVQNRSTRLRNATVAAVYCAWPRVPIGDIADAAGCNTSYVSRVAREHGAPPRTNRPSRGDSESQEEQEEQEEASARP